MSTSANLQPDIPSIPNLRDLGGHMTSDGRRVRSGLIYRSEQLSGVTAADMPAFEGLRLNKIYDLRTADERAMQPDRVPVGAEDVIEDVLADEKGAAPAQLLNLLGDPAAANATLGDGKAARMFAKGYADVVSLPSARQGFADMFSELADSANLPALFHCTTGKDRTGWAATALLTLFGVPEEAVFQDYLLSNDFILPEYRALIDKYVALGVQEEILISILGVRQEYLEESFRVMRDQFGGIEGYFVEGLGIDPAGQQALREQFLEQV